MSTANSAKTAASESNRRPSRLRPSAPLESLRGIGPVRSKALAEAGFRSISDLLSHLPTRYEDRREIIEPGSVPGEGIFTVTGRIEKLRQIRLRRRGLTLIRGEVVGTPGRLPVAWFNRPYLHRQIQEDQVYLLHGKVREKDGKLELLNPSCELLERAQHAGRIVPVYRALAGFGPAVLRRLINVILESIDLESELRDPIPGDLRRRHGLPLLGRALRDLHRPDERTDVNLLNARRSPAHLRLIYGEFLRVQLELGLVRRSIIHVSKEHGYQIDDRLRDVVRKILPFRLTAAQKRVTGEIFRDLQSPQPMLRLLQGDVGSGKTIVAAIALVAAVESGLQGAVMAPTELLAEQHFRNLRSILGDRYRMALLTGSAERAEEHRVGISSGEVQLTVGTHALVQQHTRFEKLGLAVIDEQHRFGVEQRQTLQSKGRHPDLLVMTATPIPRSLALILYGDLAVSVIDELPPGRLPVDTRVVTTRQRNQIYKRLRENLADGAQAYVVFPLIEESESVDAASIAAAGKEVQDYLFGFRCEVLHGRTPGERREKIMSEFIRGEIQVLIATTIVEVGLDAPQATAMIIESAERFGLAQLHQLRGRVGRGSRPSYAIAIHGKLGEEGRRRLEVFGSTADGFKIAEADLELRGPGDLLGTRQAGVPLFRVANPVLDAEWLEKARADTEEVLRSPMNTKYADLLEPLRTRAKERYDRFGGG